MDHLAVLSGFAVGAIVGLTGVGGGALMTPLLLSVFRLSPALAIGTDLCFAAATKLTGSIAHHRHGHVDARIVGLLLAGSLPAALVVIASLPRSDISGPQAGRLTLALGIALLLSAASVAFGQAWRRVGLTLQRGRPPARRSALTLLAGLVLGVLVTLTSIGAGAVGAALIVLIHPQLDARRVVGTDIAHAVPLTVVAGIGHAWLGHVDGALLVALLIGSVPGIWLGAHLTRRMPLAVVRGLLCLALVGAGLKLIV